MPLLKTFIRKTFTIHQQSAKTAKIFFWLTFVVYGILYASFFFKQLNLKIFALELGDIIDSGALEIENSIDYNRNVHAQTCIGVLNYRFVSVTCKWLSIICAYCTCWIVIINYIVPFYYVFVRRSTSSIVVKKLYFVICL